MTTTNPWTFRDRWTLRSAIIRYYGSNETNESPERPIGQWDVSEVTDMSFLFDGLSDFNEDISDWDVANVTSMSSMFCNAKVFNQPLVSWDVSNVRNMAYMFSKARFNQPLASWNVSRVTNMGSMFWEAIDFDQPLSQWDVSNVTNMTYMFYGAMRFGRTHHDYVREWRLCRVTDMDFMFASCPHFREPLSWSVGRLSRRISHHAFVHVVQEDTCLDLNMQRWNDHIQACRDAEDEQMRLLLRCVNPVIHRCLLPWVMWHVATA